MSKYLLSDAVELVRVDSDFTAWDEVLTLLHEAFAYQAPLIDPPSSLHTLDARSLAEKAAQEQLIIALSPAEIIGCVFAKLLPDRVYVGKMAVSPDAQGQGLGRQLLFAVEDFSREQNRQLLELQTRVELVDNHKTSRILDCLVKRALVTDVDHCLKRAGSRARSSSCYPSKGGGREGLHTNQGESQ